MGFFEKITAKFAKRRERKLENFITRYFGLELDTKNLQGNLFRLVKRIENTIFYGYNFKDIPYIAERFKEKAAVIGEGYDKGEFEYLARDFDIAARKLSAGYFSSRMEIPIIKLNPAFAFARR